MKRLSTTNNMRGASIAAIIAFFLSASPVLAQSVTINPTSDLLNAGFAVYFRYAVAFTPNGYQGPVRFQLCPPEGLTLQSFFEPSTVDPATGVLSSTLNLAVPQGVLGGQYSIRVEAVADDGTETQSLASTNLDITVRNFTISASTSALTMRRKDSAQIVVTVQPDQLLTASMYMTVAGLPPGSTATFTPQTVSCTPNVAATSVLKITTKANTPPGRYVLSIAPYLYSQTTQVVVTVR